MWGGASSALGTIVPNLSRLKRLDPGSPRQQKKSPSFKRGTFKRDQAEAPGACYARAPIRFLAALATGKTEAAQGETR